MPSPAEQFKQSIEVSRPHKNNLGQIEVDYNKPIDKDAPSVIQSIPLEHEYSEAALSLSLDALKQTEALGNKYIFWHPFSGIIAAVVASIYFSKNQLDLLPKVKEESVWSYLWKNGMKNKETLGGGFMWVFLVGTVLFKFLAILNEDYFRENIRKINEENGVEIFGFDVSKYILNSKYLSDKMILKNNVNIIVYRNTPIASVVLKTPTLDVENENDDVIIVEKKAFITALSCRRVYLKSGILEDLINWAKKRCLDLNDSIYNETNKVKGQSVYANELIDTLVFKTYSFEFGLEKLMKESGFKLQKLQKLDTSKKKLNVLLNAIGVREKIWEITVPTKE
ncbi:hypothetical protein FOG50_00916 [Hanseniaspora uvarum]|nr:hypothetical protein FOG50_00916 [Hanseniaspora uvarum]